MGPDLVVEAVTVHAHIEGGIPESDEPGQRCDLSVMPFHPLPQLPAGSQEGCDRRAVHA